MAAPFANSTAGFNESVQLERPGNLMPAKGLVVLEMSLAGVIALFGISGNALTIRVLRVPNLSKTSTAFYFTVLAAVDILVLLIGPTTKVLSAVIYSGHLRDVNNLTCKGLMFLNYSMSQISAWILVAVTIDRMIWVLLPFRARQFCTIRRACGVVLCIFGLISVINGRLLWYPTIMTNADGSVSHCATNDTFLKDVYVFYVDPALVTIGPFLVMLIANLLIIRKLREVKAKREKNLHKSTAKKKDGSNLTKMLLCTSIFYLVSSLPYLLLMMVLKEYSARIRRSEAATNAVYFIQVCTYSLFNLNYAIHFLLYCLAGPTFKAEAFRVLKLRPSQEAAGSAGNRTSRTRAEPEEAVELLDEPAPGKEHGGGTANSAENGKQDASLQLEGQEAQE